MVLPHCEQRVIISINGRKVGLKYNPGVIVYNLTRDCRFDRGFL